MGGSGVFATPAAWAGVSGLEVLVALVGEIGASGAPDCAGGLRCCPVWTLDGALSCLRLPTNRFQEYFGGGVALTLLRESSKNSIGSWGWWYMSPAMRDCEESAKAWENWQSEGWFKAGCSVTGERLGGGG